MGLVFSLSVGVVAAQPITKNKQNTINIFFICYLITIIAQKPIYATAKIPYNKYHQSRKGQMTPLLSSAFVIFREGFEVWLIMVLALASTNGNLQQQKSIWISAVAAFAATLLLGSATAAWLGDHAN